MKLSKDHRKEESDKHKHKEAKVLKIISKRNYDADLMLKMSMKL